MTSNPGVAAKDGLRAPRAEDLAAAGAACLAVYLEESCCFVCNTWHSSALQISSEAKRGQSPMPHTPRAAASPVDGAKARCARTSRRLRLHPKFAWDVGPRLLKVIDSRPRVHQKRSLGLANRRRLCSTHYTPCCCLHSMLLPGCQLPRNMPAV